MARNTPLAIVRSYVKTESFQNLDASSTADDQRLNQLIQNVQSQLAGSFDWSFLKKRWTFGIGAGARYVPFPSVDDSGVPGTPNFDRPEMLQIKYASIWQPIVYGVSEDPEFNYLDSDENQVLDPIQRWQFYDEGQLEVWPLPASSQTLRYVGQRQLTPLSYTTFSSTGSSLAGLTETWITVSVNTLGHGYYNQNNTYPYYLWFIPSQNLWVVVASNDPVKVNNSFYWIYTTTSILGVWTATNNTFLPVPTFTINIPTFVDSQTLDLDDYLVAYFVAASWLGEDNSKYKSVMAKAQARLMSLRGTNLSRTKTLIIGRDLFPNRQLLRQVPIVLVGGK